MGQFWDEIPDDPKLIEWIKNQQMFHVASAPLHGEAHFLTSIRRIAYECLEIQVGA